MSNRYGMLLDANPTELERLRLLEQSADPLSIAAFERLGVGPGWRCLEIGAGAGSMAGWLADRAGPTSVVATDLNVQFLGGLTERGVRVVHHDITADPSPGDAFDLIHLRHVLMHLPQRQQILTKLVSWLAPGGWLVVEDAHVNPELINDSAIRTARSGVLRLLADEVGSDFDTWASSLPLPLEDAGLVDAQVRGGVLTVRGGTTLARLSQLGLEQVSTRLVAAGILGAEDVAAAHAAFGDPRLLDHSQTLFCATARRPPIPEDPLKIQRDD